MSDLKSIAEKQASYLKTGVLALFVLSVLYSCEVVDENEGSGVVVINPRAVRDFEKININGVLNVYLTQGDFNRVEIETDDNLQNIVDVETINGTLSIETEPGADFNATVMNIYITATDISDLILDGVTALYCENQLVLDDLYVEKSNTGELFLNVQLDSLYINSDDIGTININGAAYYSHIQNSMTGDIHAFGFKVVDLLLDHQGTGDVEIYVTSFLEVHLDGVGDVYCKGTPYDITKTSEGIGRLYMID